MGEQLPFDGMEDARNWVDWSKRPDMSFVRELSDNWKIDDDIGDCSYAMLYDYTISPRGTVWTRRVGYVELKPDEDGQTSCYVAHCLENQWGESDYLPCILARNLADPLEACRLLEGIDADPRSVKVLFDQSIASWS